MLQHSKYIKNTNHNCKFTCSLSQKDIVRGQYLGSFSDIHKVRKSIKHGGCYEHEQSVLLFITLTLDHAVLLPIPHSIPLSRLLLAWKTSNSSMLDKGISSWHAAVLVLLSAWLANDINVFWDAILPRSHYSFLLFYFHSRMIEDKSMLGSWFVSFTCLPAQYQGIKRINFRAIFRPCPNCSQSQGVG